MSNKLLNIKSAFIFLGLFLTISATVEAQTLKEIEAGRTTLPNGWKLSPVGKLLPLGDLPLNMAVSPGQDLMAVTNNGQSDQSIYLINPHTMQLLDTVVIAKGWLGLTFSKDGKNLYASGGNDNWVMRFQIKSNKILPADTLVIGKKWPEKISIAGIAVDAKQKTLSFERVYFATLQTLQTCKLMVFFRILLELSLHYLH